jgi:hypothetical protein
MSEIVAQTTTKTQAGAPVQEVGRQRPLAAGYDGVLALQRSAGNRAVSDHLQVILDAHGHPLDPSTRRFMESRFGASFADVRIHTHTAADRAAAGVQAKAFTVGQDVVFAAGQYAPNTSSGRYLLAHELAHVVQQRHARPVPSPEITPAHGSAETAATVAAAQAAAGEKAGPVGATAVTTIQRTPENDPAKRDSLGPVADFLVDVAAGGGPAKELFAAAMRGFIAEMKTQLVGQKKGEAAFNRLQELKSVKNAGILYAGYVGGFLAGVISPLTGLFDLAVFGEKLQQMATQLLGNVLKNGSALVEEAKALGRAFVSFGKQAIGKLKALKDNPLETINALFKDLKAGAIKKANEAGHGAAISVIKSFESDFEKKRSESWRDILTKRKEGESYTQPLGLVNSLIERSKEKVLSTPWARIGYDIGHAVGAVAVNVVLLATTGGAGNAIAEIGTALVEIAPVLDRAAEAVVAIGKAIAAVEEGIAVIMQGVLKPLQTLLRELEPLFLRLRGFLRRLLGLAEDEAGALAGAAGKTAASELKPPEPKPKPDLKALEGGGQRVSPPQGKLTIVASEGKVVPPTEPHVTAVPQAEENVLAATGTEGPGVGGAGKSATAPQAAAQQPPMTASAGGKRTPTTTSGSTRTKVTSGGKSPTGRVEPLRGKRLPAQRTPDDEFRDFQKMLREEGAKGKVQTAGDPIKLGPHRSAPLNRQELGLPGSKHQSAHDLPSSVGKHIPGYKREDALTILLDRSTHRGMDQYWKDAFKAMRRAGRTTASAQEVFDTVAEAIERAPNLSPGVKASLQARLSDEMFMELGLKPGDALPLPYPNVKPVAPLLSAGPNPSKKKK